MEFSGNAAAATREVYGNVAPWMRLVFQTLIWASVGFLALRIRARFTLWRQGRSGDIERDWRVWLRRLAVFALAQKRVHRKSLGAGLHLLLAWGFLVLTIGTTLLAIADKGPVNFHRGWYYLFYELSLEIAGVGFCLGCLLAMWRRGFRRSAALGHGARDWLLLSLLLGLGVSGFLLEALRLHYTQVLPEIGRWSAAGWAIRSTLLADLELSTAREMHLIVWWLHAVMVAGLFVTIPVTRLLHIITAPVAIATSPSRPTGELPPVDLGEFATSGRLGASGITDFTRRQLLSLDACMECGRCEEACPAWAAGKPLSPKRLVVGLRSEMSKRAGDRPLQEVVGSEALWACTMCQACVQECPVFVNQVDFISELRRHTVAEGGLKGAPATALSNVARRFNPYGGSAGERLQWAAGLDVRTADRADDFEYLLWVGCAGTFDPRAQKVTRALVQLLNQAGVSFAVLGKKECCTGDPARRMGDELLFQQLARENVRTLNSCKVRKVITTCPHCLNTLRNEYPRFGGRYEVVHHSALLAELIRDGRLEGGRLQGLTVTLHDPCYLARVNGETNATRKVIAGAAPAGLREMPRNRAKTFCCGAGGGRMWFDEPAAERPSRLRAAEAAGTGARVLATACPFCLNMMSDAVSAANPDGGMQVLDVAELLANSRTTPKAMPEPVTSATTESVV